MKEFGNRNASGRGGSGTPPAVDRAISIALIVVLLFIFAGPVIYLVFSLSVASFIFGSGSDPDVDAVRRMTSAQGVITGGDGKALSASYYRLKKLAALPGESIVNTDILHVGVIEFTDKESILDRPGPAYTSTVVNIDLTPAGRAAGLLIADAPVAWQLTGASQRQRAKLAFEGQWPLELRGGHAGIVAGFRIAGFGANRTTSPRDLRNIHDRRYGWRFCGALKGWAKHFDLAEQNVRIFRFTDPTQLILSETRFSAIAEDSFELGDLRELCGS